MAVTVKNGQASGWTIRGTAFLVTDTGLFATADHVLRDVEPDTFLLGLPDPSKEGKGGEIEMKWSNRDLDLCVGQIPLYTYTSFPRRVALFPRRPHLGQAVCFLGYSPPWREHLRSRTLLHSRIGLHAEPTHVVELDIEAYEGWNSRRFFTQAPGFSGMSGAPVFDARGRVVGMHTANLTAHEGESSNPRPAMGVALLAEEIVMSLREVP